jgi:hypothetical protein
MTLWLVYLVPGYTQSTIETIPAGAYIINMGVTPQTYDNALKPYGLAYKLVTDFRVPVKWIINSSKDKDGIDFTYNGTDYKGAPFIIHPAFRTDTVNTEIAAWEALGVVGETTTSAITVEVYKTFSYFPVWVLDDANGSIAEDYLTNALIPSTAYSWKPPDSLNCCDDVYAMPHADPEWATHSNLYDWVKSEAEGGCNGYIWAACHAVSVLEAVENPSDTTQKMNFLSDSQKLVDFGDHNDGSGAANYVHSDPTHPYMQFIGEIGESTEAGSEQVYMPVNAWRSTTTIAIEDTLQEDIPTESPGPAAKLAYGPAWGDTLAGGIMYLAGHDHENGTEAENVAAQRIFLNFSFVAPAAKAIIVNPDIPILVEGGNTTTFSVSASGGVSATGNYTYEWISSCSGGTYSNSDSTVTQFTADPTSTLDTCGVTIMVTDDCGKVGFASIAFIITPPQEAPSAADDTGSTNPYTSVTVNVLENDFDNNLDSFYVSGLVGSVPASEGVFSIGADSMINFVPNTSFTGVSTIQYIVCDTTSRCDTASLAMTVAYPDFDGDGIADNIDIDDDNDGVPDSDEGSGVDPSADSTANGYPNYADPSYPDFVDINNDDINDLFDADLDGIPNHLDLDADNDGIPDAIEGNGGIAPTNYNAATATITGAVGVNGLPDAIETSLDSGLTTLTIPNSDSDGNIDILDADSDNDGIVDLVEAGGIDSDGDGQVDSFTDTNDDGIDDTILASPLSILDSDGDSYVDYLDIDADNDGIVDNIEAQSSVGYLAPTGTDTDGDGIDDQYDADNGGFPITLYDHDSDSTYDYIDSDSDGDSIADNIEGHDSNWDGVADNSCSSGDADGDGLLNCYDNVSGDDPVGSNAPIQNLDTDDDPDFRDIDDDGDGLLTSIEANDLQNNNGTPDYLEHNCNPGEQNGLQEVEVYASAVIACMLEKKDEAGGGGCSFALNAPDQVLTSKKVKEFTDSLVLDMGETIPSGGKIFIYGESDAVDVYASTNSTGPWTSIGTDLDLGNNNTTQYDSVTTSINFRYLKFTRGASGNSTKIDGVIYLKDVLTCTNAAPIATSDFDTTTYNSAININLIANDYDLYGGLIDSTSIDTAGLLAPANGTLGAINYSSGEITYTPNNGFVGVDSFQYAICDQATPALCDTAKVYITVPNTTKSTSDYTNTPYNTAVTSSVLTNDKDIEGDLQTITSLQIDSNGDGIPETAKSTGSSFTVGGTNSDGSPNTNAGTLIQNTNGSYTFTPTNGFNGSVNYEYTVCDDATDQACTTALVNIKVLKEANTSNSVVIASYDAYNIESGITLSSNLLKNDRDAEGGSITITDANIDTDGDGITDATLTLGSSTTIAGTNEDGTPVTNAGILTINAVGTFSFIPTNGFTGTITANYEVTDDDGDTDTAPLEIEVALDINNEIFAIDDSALTDAETSTVGTLLDNDFDPESNAFVVTSLYVDTDGNGLTDSDESVNIDGSSSITVAGTDTNGGSIINAGSLIIDDGGNYTFTPSSGFAGNINVTYEICDGQLPASCDWATLEISVLDVKRDYGDAPSNYPEAWHRTISDSDENNILDGTDDVWLGTSTDFESSEQSSADATADSYDDGISFGNSSGEFPLAVSPSTSYDVDITVNSTNPATVFYGMWIDWNDDGIYDDFHNGSQVTSSPATATVTITAPASYSSEIVNVRIRVDDSALSSSDYTGGKTNGEVEDFQAIVALPVELTGFSGRSEENCDVILKWQTANEKNLDLYVIERSVNNLDFEPIHSLIGTGGETPENYEYVDKTVKTNLNYYRLKIIDLDGTFEFSDIIAVESNCKNTEKVSLYPNPIINSQNTLYIKYYNEAVESVNVHVTDMNGKVLQVIPITNSQGWSILHLDVSRLSAGNYFLKINTPQYRIMTFPFVILTD